jgi:hypothetical protein
MPNPTGFAGPSPRPQVLWYVEELIRRALHPHNPVSRRSSSGLSRAVPNTFPFLGTLAPLGIGRQLNTPPCSVIDRIEGEVEGLGKGSRLEIA